MKISFLKISRRILFFSIFFFFFNSLVFANAQNTFYISEGIKRSYTEITNLRLNKAQAILDELKKTEPENMMIYHIENYIDFYRIFINENYNEYLKLEENSKKRLKKIESGNKNSPYYRFSQAEIKLQWALVRLKFEEYFTAVGEIKNAYDLLTENEKLFPDFYLNKKSLSAIHAMVGTLPDSYKSLLSFLGGMNGSIKMGSKEIAETILKCEKDNCMFRDESYAIASFIALFLENNQVKAWDLISKADLDIKNSPLACFVKSNIASKTGRNDEAIEILLHRPNSKDRLQFYYLDYMLGRSKLNRLDADSDLYLKMFINNFNGVNYIKDAYLKLAWHELVIDNNISLYKKYIAKTIDSGHSLVDEDKSALIEAKNKSLPNIVLLKSRLLFDGAYYLKAYNLLELNKKEFIQDDSKDFLEYNYRMGRIMQMMNKNSEALRRFKITIDTNKKYDSYFACNSALQSGIIFENMSDKKNAKKYYNLCLDISPSEYKSSLHQKAKAGLLRIK
ncbi:MAG: hypothetical protein R2771_02825 [Saprospiraceae bacterium]